MKLVMTLLCRNEVDIASALLDFHLHHGVDFFIAMDNASDDGTTDILESYQRLGVVRLLHQPELNFDQSRWLTQMARLAAVECGATWIINCDADEFWCPTAGSLKQVLASIPDDVQAAAVTRYNFVPTLSEETPFHARMRVREAASFNSLGRPLPPKVCHRAFSDVRIVFGNHGVSRDGSKIRPVAIDTIQILHFPMRAYAQFERKIREGTESLERNAQIRKMRKAGSTIGDNWYNLYHQYYRHGRLADYYESCCASDSAIRNDLDCGRLVIDERVHSALSAYEGCGASLEST
jgi:hypothetical protein